jgi:hypothetical protein
MDGRVMVYKTKWYDNKAWLKLYYVDKGKSIPEIATFAGISEETVRNLLIKHGLRRNK